MACVLFTNQPIHWSIFLLATPYLLLGSVVGGSKVQWDETLPFWDTIVYRNANVHLRCMGYYDDSFNNHTLIISKMIQTSSGLVTVGLVFKETVASPYDQLQNLGYQRRYSVAYTTRPQDRALYLELTLRGAVGDDGGDYRCSIDSMLHTETRKLTILTPVTAVYGLSLNAWGVETTLSGSPTVVWRANSSEGIGCAAFVDGGIDEPQVQVLLGHLDLGPGHSSPVSVHFSDHQWLTDANLVTGTDNRYHFTQLKKRYNTASADPRYHGQVVSCVGYTRGYEAHLKIATYNVIVESWPRIMCSPSVYYVSLTDALIMTCKVEAYPDLTRLEFTYQPLEGGPFVSMALNNYTSADATYRTYIENFTVEARSLDSHTVVSLAVASVEAWHVGREFWIEAANVYGTDRHTVRMELRGGSDSFNKTSVFVALVASWVTAWLLLLDSSHQ